MRNSEAASCHDLRQSLSNAISRHARLRRIARSAFNLFAQPLGRGNT
jgi:hypothetical protein